MLINYPCKNEVCDSYLSSIQQCMYTTMKCKSMFRINSDISLLLCDGLVDFVNKWVSLQV